MLGDNVQQKYPVNYNLNLSFFQLQKNYHDDDDDHHHDQFPERVRGRGSLLYCCHCCHKKKLFETEKNKCNIKEKKNF